MCVCISYVQYFMCVCVLADDLSNVFRDIMIVNDYEVFLCNYLPICIFQTTSG